MSYPNTATCEDIHTCGVPLQLEYRYYKMMLLKNLAAILHIMRDIHACGVPSELEYRYCKMRLLKNLGINY